MRVLASGHGKEPSISATANRTTAAGSRRVTLREVAKQAGVSLGMASRVLGGYGSYSEKTRRKVLEAARELDYRPNALARSLRLGRSKAIGVVVADIMSYHWTTFVRGIEDAAAQRGYQVILGTTADNSEAERRYIRALYERNVDGIILSPSSDNEEMLAKLAEDGLAMILVESSSSEIKAPRINVDDRLAAREATEHLLSLGHTSIGLVAGPQELESGRNRLEGYRDALLAAGLAYREELVRIADFGAAGGYRATRELLESRERPTALLVCNELMTGGAVQCLKDLGVSVPEEVSLVAFDDPAWASFFTPALTTVRTPRMEVATKALDALLAHIKAGTRVEEPEEVIIPTELVVRESTGPPRSHGSSVD